MHSYDKTIELVFEPVRASACGLGIVRVSPAEIEALLDSPLEGEFEVADGTVYIQEQRFYRGVRPAPSAEPLPPRVTVPGTIDIRSESEDLMDLMRGVVDGKVSWGGYSADDPSMPVQTPFISIDILREAIEPYPVSESRANEWREVAISDPHRAAVLLRQGADDPLALTPEDLLPLLEAEDRNVREVAQSVVKRTGRSKRSQGT